MNVSKLVWMMVLPLCLMPPVFSDFVADFSSGEGYANGNLDGQNGWARIFGPDPLFNVDATNGELEIDCTATGGGIRQVVSDAELGGTFDDASSVLNFSVSYTLDATSGGFNNHLQVWHGTNFTTPSFQLYLREDGFVSLGASSFIAGTNLGTGTHTISGIVDYANDTVNFVANGSAQLFGGDVAFTAGAEQVNTIRVAGPVNALSSTENLTINSISVAVIPEPSTLLLMGLAGIGALFASRRLR